MSKIPARLITYCTNIHPGDTWEETFAAVRTCIPAVKAVVAPGEKFPVGLRLSNRAAAELTVAKNRIFTTWLEENDCFIPTLNGFPFGSFHCESVKEQVYLPDWRSSERADYTIRLARLLAGWLPEGVTGSISTVPIAFKAFIGENDYSLIMKYLESVLTELAQIFDATGRKIILSLEPEPACFLETIEEVCRFFESLRLSSEIKQHLGICYDCCHQAVEFEDPADSFMRLISAGIPIAKIQVSSAISVRGEDAARLMRLNEPRYLHQVVIRRRDGRLLRYKDLPDAFAAGDPEEADEWRCHFHVPIFHSRTERTGTTQAFLQDFLPLVPVDILLEVETYTWEILPADLRSGTVTDSIVREIQWLKECLHA